MSEPTLLSQVADLLRPVSKDVSNGHGKLCLSTMYLKKFNIAFDEYVPEDLTSSFHLTDAKATLQRDLQFLLDLIKGTAALKVTPDLIEDEESNTVNLKRFKNIKFLEINKISVKDVLGIQRLRSQIQELTCKYNLETLNHILAKCGGDLSSPNLWSELKNANFSHNRILDIDNSFESTPWLNTLDLSYNQLTSVQFTNCLPNLKNLNLSYNKLEKAPRFRGPICKRLQILLLNNNFIEDLSSLYSLLNLSQLDLSQNCITDHQNLIISHMSSLSFLNLQGNPIFFHPLHRTITCNYLNKNTASLKFVLDNLPLNKSEKLLAGGLSPKPPQLARFSESSISSSQNSLEKLENMNPGKSKKARDVKIHEGYDEVVTRRKDISGSTPQTNTQYLDLKKNVEKLREERGESWLQGHSQKLLGFDDPNILSSTPSGNSLVDFDILRGTRNDDASFITAPSEILGSDETEKEKDDIEQEEKTNSIYNSALSNSDHSDDETSSGDEEICDGKVFFASTVPDSQVNDLSLILTETHLSERDSVLYKEKARWHVNVVKSCQPGENPTEVQIVFDTFRSDRKSRTYYVEDSDDFVKTMLERVQKNKVPEKRIQYQCIKCNQLFSRTKVSVVLEETIVACPKCGSSNMVIESN